MKKTLKAILGVTLLEIMLVLAIAAMIIVMSIRYYQSATSSQQTNTVMQQVQGIIAAADSLAQTSGTYTSATSANLGPLLPSNAFKLPWGETITLTPAASTLAFSLAATPVAVCKLLASRFAANNRMVGAADNACASGAAFTFTYTANP